MKALHTSSVAHHVSGMLLCRRGGGCSIVLGGTLTPDEITIGVLRTFILPHSSETYSAVTHRTVILDFSETPGESLSPYTPNHAHVQNTRSGQKGANLRNPYRTLYMCFHTRCQDVYGRHPSCGDRQLAIHPHSRRVPRTWASYLTIHMAWTKLSWSKGMPRLAVSVCPRPYQYTIPRYHDMLKLLIFISLSFPSS